MRHAGRASAGVLALISLAVIALTTLGSNPAQLDRVAETTWSCLVCGDAGTTDVLLNLLLFAPLGVGLRWLGWSGRRAVLAMCLLTLGIEATQAVLLAGRDASLSDVLANSLGGAIGWWAWPRLVRSVRPTVADARRGAALFILLGTLTWLATGWGLHPEGLPDTPWVGQPLHDWRGHDPFPGTLQRVTLNGIDVPNEPLPSTPDLSDSLVLRIALTRTDATTPRRPVSLLRIVDATRHAQASVTQRGEELLVSVRARASRWRVRTPVWRFDDAMAVPTNVPWQLAWRWLPDRILLTSGPVGSDARTTRTIPLSVGLGWAFVHPFAAPIGPPLDYRWTVLWLALWGLPPGWCLGMLGRREATWWAAAALGGYAGASLVSGLPIRASEIALLASWIGVGVVVAAWARRATRQTREATGR